MLFLNYSNLFLAACGIAEGFEITQTTGKFSIALLGLFDSIETERTILERESSEGTNMSVPWNSIDRCVKVNAVKGQHY